VSWKAQVVQANPMCHHQSHSTPFWLVVEPYPSEKYEFVSWDDEIPIYYGKEKMFETTNQPFNAFSFSGPFKGRHLHCELST